MPRTTANPTPLGFELPAFSLPDAEGRPVGPADVSDARAVLVAFISNRCPFVVGIRPALAALARRNAPQGLAVLAINSNDAGAYPEESAAAVAAEARTQGYDFPYLKDESQDVARLFHAACTPDLFLFDEARRLVYHGQFDGFRPGNDVPATGDVLQRAVDAALAGHPPLSGQVLPVGCNIKWREAAAVAAE